MEKQMENLPVIAITMGDPSGIGPEIISKVYLDNNIHKICRHVVIGDPDVMAEYAGDSLQISEISSCRELSSAQGIMEIMRVSSLEKKNYIPGKPSTEGGRSMVKAILKAVELARNKEISAIVTSPINKALMHRAGYNFEGHTQLIASLTDTEDYVMMLAGSKLRVTLVTIHCSIRDVPSNITRDNIFRTIKITADALKKDFGIKSPRIAVTALNPHAGEEGLFGNEEKLAIKPAVEHANAEGYSVTGPLPADTLYPKAARGEYDAVVNMYHDQGLIPLKLLHFSDGVNITLGLPIIRTSVDHGTAYDIAGRGIADPDSLKSAIIAASRIADNRSKYFEE